MGFVMVPVPEEHVEEAMAMILRITARARLREWDQEAMNELFFGIDEASRSVLSIAARSTLAKKVLTDVEAAERIELTRREVLGVVREINEQANQMGCRPVVVVRNEIETLPNGRTQEQRLLTMELELATLVREAEQEELRSGPGPLSSERE